MRLDSCIYCGILVMDLCLIVSCSIETVLVLFYFFFSTPPCTGSSGVGAT